MRCYSSSKGKSENGVGGDRLVGTGLPWVMEHPGARRRGWLRHTVNVLNATRRSPSRGQLYVM